MTPSQARVLLHVPGRTPEYLKELAPFVLGCGLQIRAVSSVEEARSLSGWPGIFLGAGLPGELLATMPGLGWVHWAWAGVDQLMSDAAFARAVSAGRLRLSRAVEVFGPPIAEYVLTWCLHLVRDVPRTMTAQWKRRWDRFEPDTLAGKRLGVAGLGSIGGEIARAAAAVGLEVWGLRRHVSRSSGDEKTAASGRPPGVTRVFGPEDLEEFAAGLDFCVIALPLTPETRGLFGREAFAAMKPTSVLINVGRGATVDQPALVEGLRAGRPGRAVLDVFEKEPLPRTSPLWSMPNVVLTPHHAGLSRPGEMVSLFLANLELYRVGRPLRGEVSGPLGY